MSAAIGGYYLLRTAHLDKFHDWPNHLANQFAWLPDGAIVFGWQLVREQKNLELAREWFLAAEHRGLPLFIQGLRLLVDGLNLLLNHKQGEDTDVENAIARVKPYCIAADWNSTSTAFFGEDPVLPEPLAGI